jgi:hypothetical protein
MEAIYDSDYLREIQIPRSYLYLSSVVGNFEFHETLYVDDNSIANTVLLPQTNRILFYDFFDTRDGDGTINSANLVISINSGRSWKSEKSTGPPWGLTANIAYANTGMWFSSEGTGKIALVSNVVGTTGSKVLQVGNNSISALDKVLSDFVFEYGSFAPTPIIPLACPYAGGNDPYENTRSLKTLSNAEIELFPTCRTLEPVVPTTLETRAIFPVPSEENHIPVLAYAIFAVNPQGGPVLFSDFHDLPELIEITKFAEFMVPSPSRVSKKS